MSAKDSQFFSSLIEKGEFRVDDEGHALLFGEFLFLIPPMVILELQDELADRLGDDEMQELMADMGRYHIRQAVERQSEDYDLDTVSRENLLRRTINILNILGWGKAEITSFDPDTETFSVRMEHPTLPSVLRNRREETADAPICHYLRGVIEQDFQVLFDSDITAEETQCAGVEGSVCVFEGGPTD